MKLILLASFSLSLASAAYAEMLDCKFEGTFQRTLTIEQHPGSSIVVLDPESDYPVEGKVKQNENGDYVYAFKGRYIYCGGAQIAHQTSHGLRERISDFIYYSGDCGDARRFYTMSLSQDLKEGSIAVAYQARSRGSYFRIEIPGRWRDQGTETTKISCKIR